MMVACTQPGCANTLVFFMVFIIYVQYTTSHVGSSSAAVRVNFCLLFESTNDLLLKTRNIIL
jgi:hypothetical protein